MSTDEHVRAHVAVRSHVSKVTAKVDIQVDPLTSVSELCYLGVFSLVSYFCISFLFHLTFCDSLSKRVFFCELQHSADHQFGSRQRPSNKI